MSSEDSDSDTDIPEVSVCKRLCEDFAEITGTDTACAQFYLQDRKWDLDRSVNDFFEDRNNRGAVRVNNKKEAEVVVVVDESNDRLAAAATAVLAESALSHSTSSTNTPSLDNTPTSSTLKFITWNIDGLNEKNLKLRTKAVCKNIEVEQADIVFLQEVVPESAEYFLTHLPSYHCTFGNEDGYFVGTLLKKSSITFISSEIIEYPITRMMRNILKVDASFKKLPLCLMNSHLESTTEGSEERKNQLKSVFKRMLNAPEMNTVIFAGDMNLRDKELKELGGLPAGIEDLWITCGSRKECAYTFDMTRNDNLIYNGRFKPRCRFDRVYIRHSSPAKLKPVFFGLIGLERLLPHRCFPSDHWGILCHFEME